MKILTLTGVSAVDENGEEYFIKFPEPYTPSTVVTYSYPSVDENGQIIEAPTPNDISYEEEKSKQESASVDIVLSKHQKNGK